MILGAGLGSRLRPLTDHTPKILVPVLETPMLGRLLGYLHHHGITQIAMNTHHLSQVVQDFLQTHDDAQLQLFHEDTLLGTGGGIANIAPFWGNSPLLVWNGDILADLPPVQLATRQDRQKAVATLAVQERSGSSKLLVDDAGWLCGIDSVKRGITRTLRKPEGEMHPFAFQGISLLDSSLQPLMVEEARRTGGVFDLIDFLLQLVEAGHPITTLNMAGFWGSSGTPAQIEALEQGLQAQPELLAQWEA